MIVKVAVIHQEPVTVQLDAVTRTSSSDVQVYDGPYEAIPKVTAQTLPTENKLMLEDISVRAIPYFNVSNPSGGNTIYIANEV